MEPQQPDLPDITDPVLEGSRGRKMSPRIIAARKRAGDAVRLRLAGYSLQAIADRLGYSGKSAVYEIITSTIDRYARKPAEDLRDLEIQRLDQLLISVWPYALGIHQSQMMSGRPGKPDLQALDRVLAIERQRALILGLNAPTKFDVRAFVMEMAEAEGFSEDEKRDAVEFVEHHLREMRARS